MLFNLLQLLRSQLFFLLDEKLEDGYETSDSCDDNNETGGDYDYDDYDNENDKPAEHNNEHSNPSSLSWAIIRLAIVKHASLQLMSFIHGAGIESQGRKVSWS